MTASSTTNAKHIVRAISFPPGENDGPCECSCGDEMQASEFSGHRKAVAAGTGMNESDLPRSYSIWRRTDGKVGARKKGVSR